MKSFKLEWVETPFLIFCVVLFLKFFFLFLISFFAMLWRVTGVKLHTYENGSTKTEEWFLI